MRNPLKDLFLSKKLFYAGAAIVFLFVISFSIPFLLLIAKAALVMLIVLLFVDIILLFKKNLKVDCQRKTPKILSLGSENDISIVIKNSSAFALNFQVLEELPFQFQEKTISYKTRLKQGEKDLHVYNLTPNTRGKYGFGKIHIYAKTFLGLAERRLSKKLEEVVPVYPSVKAMKLLEMKTHSHLTNALGFKKTRRVGHTYEFDQIKNYVKGDDYSSINWKATSRSNNLMVNHYEDEKAQQVYSLIDKSRSMLMPFNNMSLLDYAINASLVISNTALKKYDKTGLITFSHKTGNSLKAVRSHTQLTKILETLYNEKEDTLEANFELLYTVVKNFVKGRSLLFLYTNFESKFALERALPALRKISKLHLLVVVVFENTEILEYSETKATNIEEIYFKTIASKFTFEKKQIAFQLKQFGIQTIVTKPEDLSINTINKYFELKSRGLI